MTNLRNVKVSLQDTVQLDAFGRLRVSNPVTIFDSKQIFDNQPLFWDDSEVSGTGTSSSYNQNAARTRLSVTASTAGKRVRQTFRRFNYEPGKSQLIFLTGRITNDNAGSKTGLTTALGFFDDDNGLFFSYEDGVAKVTQRTNVSGTPSDTENVAQSSWNVDTMDGNGASGIDIDFSDTNIFFIDFEWLGVGRVRMGFVIDGIPYVCHQFLNANLRNSVYMSTPNLPLRYEIENDGTGIADTIDHICATVISEGGTDGEGIIRYTSTAGTHVDANTENTIYAIIGIRLKTTHIGATIRLVGGALQLQTASEKVEWILKFNPTVAGTFTYSDVTNSAVQVATGVTANTVTGGVDIGGGFFESGGAPSGSAGSADASLSNALLLGSDISGTVDEMVLCVRPVGGSTNVDVEGSLTWRELS